MSAQTDEIKAQKKLLPGIYRKYGLGLENQAALIACISGSGIVMDFLNNALGAGLAADLAVWVFIYVFIRYARKIRTKKIDPYIKGQYFVGLCSISEEDIAAVSPETDSSSAGQPEKSAGNIPGRQAWLSRKNERKYILNEIRKRAEAEDEHMHRSAVCLTGSSGCGKSVLLELVKNDAGKEFDIRSFSEIYPGLEYLPVEEELKDRNGGIEAEKGLILVFDQFEQYFDLSDAGKRKIRSLLEISSAMEKTAVVFAVRKDRLADFLNEIDLNDIGRKPDGSSLRKIMMAENISSKKAESESGIENAAGLIICVDNGDSSDMDSVEEQLRRRCVEAQLGFNDGNENLGIRCCEAVSGYTLLEQQIILNICENEKFHPAVIEEMTRSSLSHCITRYYDRQLCSTGNFYDSCRILYLLSAARNNLIRLSLWDVYEALCVPAQEETELAQLMMKLDKLYLISFKNSFPEVAHDYIARSFESYAWQEMTSDVRTAIDNYIARHIYESRESILAEPAEDNIEPEKDYSGNYKEFRKKWTNDRAAVAAAVISAAAVVLFTVFVNLFMDPKRLSIVVPALSLFSMLYVFNYYRNITRYCRKRKTILAVLYAASFIFGIASVVLQYYADVWLICLSLGTLLAGVSSIISGVTGGLEHQGKDLFFKYGIKTAAFGFMIALISFFVNCMTFGTLNPLLWVPGGTAGMLAFAGINVNLKLAAEVLVMAALLIYSYSAHMRRDYFYCFEAALMEAE